MSTPSERDRREARVLLGKIASNVITAYQSENRAKADAATVRAEYAIARALAARSAVPDKVLDAYEDVVRSVDALPVDLGEHLRCIGSTLAASCVQNLKDAMKCLRLEKEAAEAAARGGER